MRAHIRAFALLSLLLLFSAQAVFASHFSDHQLIDDSIENCQTCNLASDPTDLTTTHIVKDIPAQFDHIVKLSDHLINAQAPSYLAHPGQAPPCSHH